MYKLDTVDTTVQKSTSIYLFTDSTELLLMDLLELLFIAIKV